MTDQERERVLARGKLALDVLAEKESLLANLKPEDYELLADAPYGPNNAAVLAGVEDFRHHLVYAQGVVAVVADQLKREAERRLTE